MAGQLWNRLPGEDDRMFTAFCTYRDLTPPRVSPERFAAAFNVSSEEVVRWFIYFHWKKRADAFEAWIATARQPAQKAIEEEPAPRVVAKHKELLAMSRELVAHELAKHLGQSKTSAYPRTKPRELAQIMKLTIQLYELTKGEPEVSEVDENDLDSLTDQELADYDRIAQKARGKTSAPDIK